MNLELNCANVVDEGRGISIPPKNANRYPVKIGVKSLKEFRDHGGEMIVIPAVDGRKPEQYSRD